MAGGDDGGIKPFGPPVVGFFPGTSERHFPFSANQIGVAVSVEQSRDVLADYFSLAERRCWSV